MNLSKNMKNLHKKFSYNLFSFCGYIILLGSVINLARRLGKTQQIKTQQNLIQAAWVLTNDLFIDKTRRTFR